MLLKFTVSNLRKLLFQNGYPQGIVTYNIDVSTKSKKCSKRKDLIILLPYLGMERN